MGAARPSWPDCWPDAMSKRSITARIASRIGNRQEGATAHAEIFGLLGEATGYPALTQRAGLAAERVNDVTLAVGPAAEGAGREMEHHLRGLQAHLLNAPE
jgi:hypothetical protein